MILYKITFTNGKSYIGITSCSIERRMALHFHHAKKNRQGALQRAIRKYGRENLQVIVLQTADSWDELCILEMLGIAKYNTKFPNGYNLTNGAEGNFGNVMSEETKKKISIAKMGMNKGIAFRGSGWKHTEAAKEKIAEAGRGKIFTEERKAKIGASKLNNKYNLGRIVTEETKKKISDAQKGRPVPEERKVRMSASAKIRGISDETRAKMNLYHQKKREEKACVRCF